MVGSVGYHDGADWSDNPCSRWLIGETVARAAEHLYGTAASDDQATAAARRAPTEISDEGLEGTARYGLIALYVAVFPANVNMVLNHLPLGDAAVPMWALWARLPMQAVLIALAWWVSREDTAGSVA